MEDPVPKKTVRFTFPNVLLQGTKKFKLNAPSPFFDAIYPLSASKMSSKG